MRVLDGVRATVGPSGSLVVVTAGSGTTPSDASGSLPLRRNRDFVLLQLGQLLSSFGSSLSTIAYPLLTLAVTHSPAKAGYVSAMLFAPMLVFGLAAGLAADRFDRRRLMIASDIVGAGALATLGWAVIDGATSLSLILVVAFVDSMSGVFFRAAQSGAFRAVVPLPQIAAAASIVQARLSTVRLGAPPLGGALFGVARSIPFIADAASYAFSTGSLLLMRTRFQEKREPDPAPLRRRLADGVSVFIRIPFLRTTLLMIAVSNFTVTGIELTVIVLAKRAGLPSAAIGGLVALTGAATLLGSLASPLLRRALPMRRILLGEYWAALGYIVFLLWPNVYVLAGAFAAQAFWFPKFRLRGGGLLLRAYSRSPHRTSTLGVEHAARDGSAARTDRRWPVPFCGLTEAHDHRACRSDDRGRRSRNEKQSSPCNPTARRTHESGTNLPHHLRDPGSSFTRSHAQWARAIAAEPHSRERGCEVARLAQPSTVIAARCGCWPCCGLGRRGQERRADLRRDTGPIVDQPEVGDAAFNINVERDDAPDVDCASCGLMPRHSPRWVPVMCPQATALCASVTVHSAPMCTSGNAVNIRRWDSRNRSLSGAKAATASRSWPFSALSKAFSVTSGPFIPPPQLRE